MGVHHQLLSIYAHPNQERVIRPNKEYFEANILKVFQDDSLSGCRLSKTASMML